MDEVVAFVPIRLNSKRLPGKNLLELGGKPLCRHLLETLVRVPELSAVYVYCSQREIVDYLPPGVTWIQRSEDLDGDGVRGGAIYRSFIREVQAKWYLLAHVTSPFLQEGTIQRGLDAVRSLGKDSALTVRAEKTFAWFNHQPLNYNPQDVPRTQELASVYLETSGYYLFEGREFLSSGRRVGYDPEFVEVQGAESLDIDTQEDFELARVYSLSR